MFRKPKRRNDNQRQNIQIEEATDSTDTLKPTLFEDHNGSHKPMPVQKSVLTFAEEEEEERWVFWKHVHTIRLFSIIPSRNLFVGDARSNLKTVHKVRKHSKKSKAAVSQSTISSSRNNDVVEIKHEIKHEIEDSDEETTKR